MDYRQIKFELRREFRHMTLSNKQYVDSVLSPDDIGRIIDQLLIGGNIISRAISESATEAEEEARRELECELDRAHRTSEEYREALEKIQTTAVRAL